ncbi:polyadenylation and cleavage factor homolog 4-like isoform X2 [Tripterygium wilfordii]|nr:polyadenylation and cleavage factor homolog 4-like isoform X2 [Tripterygium wilfordii]
MYQSIQNESRNTYHGFPHHQQTWNPPYFSNTTHNFQTNQPSVPRPLKRSRNVYEPCTSAATPNKIQACQRFSHMQHQENRGFEAKKPNLIPNNHNRCSYQGNNLQFYPSRLEFIPFPPPLAVSTILCPTVPPPSVLPQTIENLLNSLISFSKENPPTETPVIQDSMGLEFDPVKLKVRHESVINSLYRDLPRQCTSCGNRFRTQEEHSEHMDWHVKKNRMAKNLRKKKGLRGWNSTVDMWLVETKAMKMVETKDADDFNVYADEDQKVCALCQEAFDEYYSDEAQDWMYRGAVYLNAHNGSTEGMEKSQLGPIIHIKCGPEPVRVPSMKNWGENR